MMCLTIAMTGLLGSLASAAQVQSHRIDVRDRSGPYAGPRDLALIENRGQWDCDAHFVGLIPDLLVRAEPHALGLQIPDSENPWQGGTYLRLVFEGSSAGVTLIPERPGAALHSWFLGNDSGR